MHYDDLTPEQKKHIAECKTPEEILALAHEEGYELSDEELEQITGGGQWTDRKCPNCGSQDLRHNLFTGRTTCQTCKANW